MYAYSIYLLTLPETEDALDLIYSTHLQQAVLYCCWLSIDTMCLSIGWCVDGVFH